MKRVTALLLAAVMLMGITVPASANDAPFGTPEKVSVAIGGEQIRNGKGFLKNFTYLTESDMETVAAAASGESTYRLGLGDCFSEMLTYSTLENHGTPVWGWRRVYGLDVKLMAEALGIDTQQAVSVTATASDGMVKTLTDAFGVKAKRYTFDVSGNAVSEISPILALFETSAETETEGGGSYPVAPVLGKDSPDRVGCVFGFGQTSTDEVTACFWVKDVARLRYGAEAIAFKAMSADGKTMTASASAIAANGIWSAEFGSVKAQGIPLTELLKAMGVPVSEGESVKAVSASGDTMIINQPESAFAAWQASENGSAVKNSRMLRLYCTDGRALGEFVSAEICDGATAGESGETNATDAFRDMAGYDWAAEAVEALRGSGVITGGGDGSFYPGADIKRGDFVLMLARAYRLTADAGDGFSDVPQDSYYHDAIAAAKALGIAKGSGERFYPENTITRQEAMALLYRAMTIGGKTIATTAELSGFADAAALAPWAEAAAGKLVGAGIINGAGGVLSPDKPMTRAEMAAALYRALNQ